MKLESNIKRPSRCLARLVRSFLALRTERLWHPDSPGMRITVTRSRFGRWWKPAKFATLGETIKSYRANTPDQERKSPASDCSEF